MELQPTIHLAGLSFDPLLSDFSDIHPVWKDSGSLYLLQLSTNDGQPSIICPLHLRLMS